MSSTISDAEFVARPITFNLSQKTAPNRVLKSAMTERLCVWEEGNPDNGKPTPDYLQLYQVWGQCDVGVMVLGNLPVDVTALEAKGNAVIDMKAAWASEHVKLFTPVVAAAGAGGSLVIAQLTHGGRQTSDQVNQHPVSASDVQLPPCIGLTFAKPRPMTIAEIEELAVRFAYASKVIYDCGGDGVQLHAAHGYLLSQFLSPRVNLRTDKYGGSPENRSRIVLEIIHAVRAAVPDPKFIISIKINSADFADGGFSAEESFDLIQKLDPLLDLIELSGGSYESRAFLHVKESTIKREAFFIEFAARIRPNLHSAKLAVTGGFRTTRGCAQALREGSCDIVGMARPLTAEPDLAKLLVTGVSTGAKENLVPAGIQTGSSVMQIKDIATGAPIRDLSIAEIAAATTATLMGK